MEQSKKIIDDWIKAINVLIEQIKLWLSEPIEKGELIANEITVNKCEEQLGSYNVPMLVLIGKNTHIDVCPAGRFAIGSIGRVDITNYKRSFTFLYSKSKGWLSLDSRKPLTETSLIQIVNELKP
jgi:hypothetical protein